MKKLMTIVLSLVCVFHASTLYAEPSRKELFLKDYDNLFQKHLEFESRTFQINPQKDIWEKRANNDLVKNPPFNADQKIYYINGFITKKEGQAYMAEFKNDGRTYYFAFAADEIETERGKKNILQARQNGGFSIIGKFVGLIPYKTVLGVEKKMPAFNALHFEVCEPRLHHGYGYCDITN